MCANRCYQVRSANRANQIVEVVLCGKVNFRAKKMSMQNIEWKGVEVIISKIPWRSKSYCVEFTMTSQQWKSRKMSGTPSCVQTYNLCSPSHCNLYQSLKHKSETFWVAFSRGVVPVMKMTSFPISPLNPSIHGWGNSGKSLEVKGGWCHWAFLSFAILGKHNIIVIGVMTPPPPLRSMWIFLAVAVTLIR